VLELVAALALFIGPQPLAGPTVAWGDAQHAWAGGGGGILVSRDGGTTWRRQTRAPALQLAATDARHAWALSAQGVTVRTTDGVHWRSLGVQHLMRLSFVDATHGFALGRDDFVLRTTDGGVTWTPVGGPSRLQSICFSTARRGWVARNGTVWATSDAGVHWKSRLLMPARQGYPLPELGCRGSSVWVVLHGGAAAGSEGYVAERSLDWGANWRPEYAQFLRKGLPSIDAYAGPFAVLGGSDAVLEGSCDPCGQGRVTLLRGSRRTTFSGWAPGPLAFAGRSRGLVLLTRRGERGASIFRSTEGGRSWGRVFTSSALVPS
jgi:photosystem II stability/assembly factor-like uncharacterized protein